MHPPFSLHQVHALPEFFNNCECMVISMKIVFTGKLRVVCVKQSVSDTDALHVTEGEVNGTSYCGDIHSHFCVFVRGSCLSFRKLTMFYVSSVSMTVLICLL